jgi:predicted dinucleotide-binding enzyme
LGITIALRIIHQEHIMNIGIIGAGFIGRAVAQLALTAGHQVMLSNSRGAHTLSAVTGTLPGSQAGSVEQAIEFAELILVAIPLHQFSALPAGKMNGKTVLDANNYYPRRDGHIAALDEYRTTTSQLLADYLPGATVVKAFNAILAADLLTDGRPSAARSRRALPVASDDTAAKARVIDLLDQFGFDSVDAGGLADSWRFERAKPAYCIPFDASGLRQALAAAERDVEAAEGSWRHR